MLIRSPAVVPRAGRRPSRLPWRRPDRRGGTFGGSTPGSVTFPTARLNVRVRIALGADLTASWLTWQWTDITAYVRYATAIVTSTGRKDEAGVVGPGRTVLTLDNRDGRFSRRNPIGPYYGLLSRNTPIWIEVDAGSGWKTRVMHFVNEWPTRWDKSGNDSTVPIVCAGILRRLHQGTVTQSALRRAIMASTAPLAYWPLEDGVDATDLASGLINGTSMTVRSGTVALSGGVAVPGSLSAACNLGDGTAILTAPVPAVTATSWQLEAVLGSDSLSASTDAPQLQINTPGTISRWGIETFTSSSQNHWSLYYQDTSTGFLVSYVGSTNLRDGAAHHVRITAAQSGADITVTLYVDGALENGGTVASRTLTMPTEVVVNPLGVTGNNIVDMAHIVVWAPTATQIDVAAATDGYAGEMAHERIERTCADAGIPYASTGKASTSQLLGPQPMATPLGVMRDAESVDTGVLYEAEFGLAYQTKAERYNAIVGLTLDFDLGQVAEAPEPADDDQKTVNRFTASRTGGSEATAEDSASIAADGLYDDSATVNVYADDQLVHVAGWRVHQGTVDEDRWPSVEMNFTRKPDLIDTWAALAYGARLNVLHPPDEVAPDTIDGFIEGYEEAFRPDQWRAVLNTTPATVYEVFQVEATGNRGRLDTLSSTLSADVGPSDTSLVVASTNSVVWVQGAVSFDINIAGERITVTNISGSSSPQTFTVTRSVNGVTKAQTAIGVDGNPTPVRSWRAGVLAL